MGVCYAAAISTLLTAENCRTDGNNDCQHLNKDKIFSVLQVSESVGYGVTEGGNLFDSVSHYMGDALFSSEAEFSNEIIFKDIPDAYTQKNYNSIT